jgi:hypothetical protein
MSAVRTVEVKSITGQTWELKVPTTGTINDLKLLIQEHSRVPVESQRLIQYGRQLEASSSIATVLTDMPVHLQPHLGAPVGPISFRAFAKGGAYCLCAMCDRVVAS